MSQLPTDVGFERAQLRAARSFLLLVVCLLAVLGFAFLGWRATHPDSNNRIPQPTMALQVPKLLLQFTGRKDGLHCIALPGYGKKWALSFERRTYMSEPSYQRAWNGKLLGIRLVVLSHHISDGDMIFSPFGALIFPYQFLMLIPGCLTAYFLYSLRFWLLETQKQQQLLEYECQQEEVCN